jgi:hypothetical protein
MAPRAVLAGVLALLLSGCSSESKGFSIPADRPILGWSGSSAIDANRGLLPGGFAQPDERVCAPDTSRIYIAEMFTHAFNDVQVNYHWAPVVRGPRADVPTLNQPEFSLSGTVLGASLSTEDVLADHPYGFDFVSDVVPDSQFAFMVFKAPALTPNAIHPEVEERIFPRAALGWVPQANDRTLLRGVWILDCGHPPYGSEVHPPTFLGYARPSDLQTTVATALVVPYRSSLLFNPNPALATDFANAARFDDLLTKPFPIAFQNALLKAAQLNEDRLTTHALMSANRFDILDWLVCAPLPRPAGAALDARWRFTARTGVTVNPTTYDAEGCVRFTASMSAAYVPMALTHTDVDWPWAQISEFASNQLGQSIDVRLALIEAAKAVNPNAAAVPALQEDHPPLVDAYPQLLPLPGADQDSPTAIQTSDDQAFPLYGRVRVGWK